MNGIKKYYRVYTKLMLCVVFFFCFFNLFSQDYQSAGVIFRDRDIAVSIEFKIARNLCDPTSSRKSKWRYVIAGKSNMGSKYLVWQMDYLTCDQRVIRVTNSFDLSDFEKLKISGDSATIESSDFDFSGIKVVRGPYNARLSVSASRTLPEEIHYTLAEPKYIQGDSIAATGQKVTLKIIGTDMRLSPDSKWVWYKNSCGSNKVGEGEEIDLFPKENSTYSVRAENRLNQSKCVSISIRIDNDSYGADGIKGGPSICKGGSAKLEVVGGRLGLDAQWTWFKDSCKSVVIGTGSSLIVTPEKQTIYYVSAIGKTNATECKSVTLSIDSNYSSPSSVISTKTVICEGETLGLHVQNGQISKSARWVWYTNKGISGYGESLLVTPTLTTVYKVRGEGVCGSTEYVSQEIQVLSKSARPYLIETDPGVVVKNATVILRAQGTELTNGTEWVWYKNKADDKEIGRGRSIIYSFRKPTNIIIRAENSCYKSEYIQKNITIKSKVRQSFYFINLGVVSSDLANTESILSNVDITLGFKKQKGVYIRGKFNLEGSNNTSYNTSDDKLSNYFIRDAYYKYNGKDKVSRFSLTGGLLLGSHTLMVYLGGGYGEKNLFWGIDEYSIQGTGYLRTGWAKNVDRSVSGPELEAGFLLCLGPVNLMGGINNIFQTKSGQINPAYKNYIDAHIGIGLNF